MDARKPLGKKKYIENITRMAILGMGRGEGELLQVINPMLFITEKQFVENALPVPARKPVPLNSC